MAEKWFLSKGDAFQHNQLCQYIERIDRSKEWVVEITQEKKERTLTQNRAMHKYFKMLADNLNEAGLEMDKVLRVPVKWNENLIKELIWRPVQKTVTEQESTTRLTTEQVNEIYEYLNRFFGTKFGLYIPFPSRHGD